MSIWTCGRCNHSYIPEQGDAKHGIPLGTPWGDLPQDWTCPECGAPKFIFRETAPNSEEASGWTVD